MENLNLGIGSLINHPEYGDGVIIQIKNETYVVRFIKYGVSEIKRNYEKMTVLDSIETPEDLMSFQEIEKSLVKILRQFADIQETVEMADKWRGGTMILKPGKSDLQSKEIPISVFFHKIVMLRDRLRVLEQNINSSNLDDEEKVNIHQYITRAYGTLTTFNILFKFPEDAFKGQGK